MSRIRAFNAAALIGLAVVLFFVSGCSTRPSTGGESSAQPTTPGITKPKPSVESVDAKTTGTPDEYYAILDVTAKNDGADGMVIISGAITQAGQTITKELPVYMIHNTKEVVRLVFPLKWKGGDWTPKVDAQVP
jgi:hypothetical protein